MTFARRISFFTLAVTIGFFAALVPSQPINLGGSVSASTGTMLRLVPGVPESISISPARSLGSVLALMGDDIRMHTITLVEERGRELVFQLAPPARDSSEILAQYEIAYRANYGLLRDLLSSGSEADSPSAHAATDAELSRLGELFVPPRTLDTVIVSAVSVDGPAAQVDDFRRALGE